MAKSKTYELLLKIGGKTDSSLKAACATAEKNLNSLGNTARAAGKVIGAAAVATATAVATMGTAAIKSAAEYETQLANISTLLTGTEAEVAARTAEIGQQVLEISNRTGVVTADLTDGMYQVVSAFGDSADAASILETAAKSAAAGNATTTDSINMLSAVTKGYGDTTAEAVQKAADLAFATVRLGQTSFPELASSIGDVIPLANTLGVEQEQLFGAMATLTGVTGSTSEVATQLKNVMQAFLSPSKEMTAALQSLGYESGQALLESEGLQGALVALKGSVNDDELAFANLFSSVRAKTAVLSMAGSQAENLTSKTAEMYEVAGAANLAFERQTNTLAHDIQMIKNLGANFLTQLGTNILPYVRELAEWALPLVSQGLENISSYITGTVIPAVKNAVEWVVEHKNLILALAAGVTTAVGAFKALKTASAAVGAVKSLSTIFKAASTSGGLLSKVLGLGGVKMALIAAAIALVVTGLVHLWKNSEQFRETVMGIWAKLQPLFQSFGDMLTVVWEKVGPLLQVLGGILLKALERAVILLAPVVENLIGVLTGITDFIGGIFSGDTKKAMEGLQTIFKNALSALGNLAKAGFTAILEIGSAIWPLLDQAVMDGIAAIGERFPALGEFLGTVWSSIQAAWENVQAIFENIIDFIDNVFSGNWSGAWENIVNIFGNVFGLIVNLAKVPINAVISAINWVLGKINSISVTIPDWVPGVGGTTLGFNIPTIPTLAAGGIATAPTLAQIGEGGEPEAVLPLSKLAAMLDDIRSPKPADNSGGGDGSTMPAPVFHFHFDGQVTREQAEEAGRVSFAEFKRLYERMKAEERRKSFTTA